MNGLDSQIFDRFSGSLPGVRKESLTENVLVFCRVLKRLKINITMGRVLDAFRSIRYINISNREELYYALRGNLISDYYEIPLFDSIFQVFWFFFEKMHDGDDVGGSQQGLEKLIERECLLDEWAKNDEPEQSDGNGICLYSPVENLACKDFSEFTDEDIERIKEEIADVVKRIVTKKSRRRHPDPKGRDLSLRHTLRKSMKYGGEIFKFATTKKR